MCKSLTSFFYQLKLNQQVFLGIIVISFGMLVILAALIAFNVYLLSLSAYKDSLNMMDIQEYSQLSHIAVSLENSKLQMEEFFRDYSFIIARMKENFYRQSNYEDNLGLVGAESLNNVMHKDAYDSTKYDPMKTIIYFSPMGKYSASELQSRPGVMKLVKVLKIMFEYLSGIFYSQLFPGSSQRYFNYILLVDYENELLFQYPANATELNFTVNLESVKDYVVRHSENSFNLINFFNAIVPITTAMPNISDIPVFRDKELFTDFFVHSSTTRLLSFSSVTKISKDKVTATNLRESLIQNVFLISSRPVSDIIYDPMYLISPAIRLLISDYQYPYNIYTPVQCVLTKYLTMNTSLHDEDPQTVADCFSTQNSNKYKYYPNWTDKDEFFTNMGLFNEKSSYYTFNAKDSNSTKTVIAHSEKMVFANYSSAFNQGIIKRFDIHDSIFKVKKLISPLSAYSLFEYYYPLNDLYITFILKNEGFSRYIATTIFTKALASLISGFLWCLVLVYFILVFIIYHLRQVMKLISTPLELIDKTIKLISANNFQKNFKELEQYTESIDKGEVIDEFVDLIKIILDMIEGNIDLKQILTHKEATRLKLEDENFNREFEMIKMNNMIVLEEVIEEMLEKKNYYNEIIQFCLDDILKDPTVSKNEIFMKIYRGHLNIITTCKAKRHTSFEGHMLERDIREPLAKFPFADIYADENKEQIRIQDNVEEGIGHSENIQDEEFYSPKMKSLTINDKYIVDKLNDKCNPFYQVYDELFS